MSQPRLSRAFTFFYDGRIGRKPVAAGEINRQTDQHANASSAEAVMPAIHFAERPGDERRDDHARIDEDVLNLERVGATIVASRVQRADLAGKISLETTDADEKARQRDEKGDVESNEKLAGSHE